jgi:hypothetical protein
MNPIHRGREAEKPGNYRGNSFSAVCDKIFSGILAGRPRDWLICHKVLVNKSQGPG